MLKKLFHTFFELYESVMTVLHFLAMKIFGGLLLMASVLMLVHLLLGAGGYVVALLLMAFVMIYVNVYC